MHVRMCGPCFKRKPETTNTQTGLIAEQIAVSLGPSPNLMWFIGAHRTPEAPGSYSPGFLESPTSWALEAERRILVSVVLGSLVKAH